MTKEQFVIYEIILQGPSIWNEWRRAHPHTKINLREIDLSMANLEETDLAGADLVGVRLSRANLQRANFTRADLRMANLIGANLNGARITDAWLWETQRAGWSIQGIVCEAAYWDRGKQERKTYRPGEFERFHADHTKIVLRYEDGIKPIEIATLPALIQWIEAAHPDCVLRLHSVQDAPGGAIVTLVVEDAGGRNPGELQTLQADIEVLAQRVIRAQRALLEERGIRERIQSELDIVYNKILPHIMGGPMERPQSIQINVSGGTIHGNIVGDVSGANAEVNYAYNEKDLATIKAFVIEMLIHQAELHLTAPQRAQFERQMNAIQEQLAAQTPNHSLLREALHTLRHILEAGAAHALVGPWLVLLQKLG